MCNIIIQVHMNMCNFEGILEQNICMRSFALKFLRKASVNQRQSTSQICINLLRCSNKLYAIADRITIASLEYRVAISIYSVRNMKSIRWGRRRKTRFTKCSRLAAAYRRAGRTSTVQMYLHKTEQDNINRQRSKKQELAAVNVGQHSGRYFTTSVYFKALKRED